MQDRMRFLFNDALIIIYVIWRRLIRCERTVMIKNCKTNTCVVAYFHTASSKEGKKQ